MLLTSVFYVSLSIKMGVYLYLYLHTNTDEEVYGKIWSRQFTVVLSWGNGLPGDFWILHTCLIISFSIKCVTTLMILFSVSSWKDITM